MREVRSPACYRNGRKGISARAVLSSPSKTIPSQSPGLSQRNSLNIPFNYKVVRAFSAKAFGCDSASDSNMWQRTAHHWCRLLDWKLFDSALCGQVHVRPIRCCRLPCPTFKLESWNHTTRYAKHLSLPRSRTRTFMNDYCVLFIKRF